MSPSSIEYLRHMLDEVNYLMETSRGLSKHDFLKDETLKRAFVRSLEVIGEASKSLPEELKENYRRLDWRAMAGMRDRLIHGYFGIDYELVWDVIENKLPALEREIAKMLSAEVSDH